MQLGGRRSWATRSKNLGEDFEEYWAEFSRRGGINSMKFKRALVRKTIGPRGERMYNELERLTAQCMDERGFDYICEPAVRVGKKTIFPDFKVGDLIIECTEWGNSMEKSKRLRERFSLIEAHNPEFCFVVVTSGKMEKRYAKNLEPDVKVVKSEDFPKYLDSENYWLKTRKNDDRITRTERR